MSLIINEHIEGGEVKTVADLGCGVGYKTAQIAKHFTSAKVFGFDFSVNGISNAEKYWKDFANLSFSTKDVTENLHETYDLVCAFDVLEHIEDWQEMVDKVILIANKYILFAFPTGRMRSFEPKLGHFRNFKKHEVEKYMQMKGLTVVKAIYAGFPFYSPIMRDLTNLFYKDPVSWTKITWTKRILHKIVYFFYRYFSSKKIGDMTFCLFKKDFI